MLEALNPRRTGRAALALRRILRVIAWLLAPVLLYWVAGLFLYRFLAPAVTPLMLIRSLERGEMIWQQGAPLDEVAEVLRAAVVVAEDSNFCLHPGIDLHAAKDALEDYVASGRLRGASTITMQVARNLFLWPGGGAPRKALEIPGSVSRHPEHRPPARLSVAVLGLESARIPDHLLALGLRVALVAAILAPVHRRGPGLEPLDDGARVGALLLPLGLIFRVVPRLAIR